MNPSAPASQTADLHAATRTARRLAVIGAVTKRLALIVGLLCITAPVAAQGVTLLNVSYDVMRDFYKDFNPAFVKSWKEKHNQEVTIQMSHGGSSRQARAVVDGLEADVITMNQANDIDLLAQRGALVPTGWQKRLPDNSAPFTSATVFIVRKGNPQQVRDWADLAKPGIAVIVPNPKTSGNGRYTYLTAWQYALKQAGGAGGAGSAAAAEKFVTAIFKNVPVLDTGGRAATTTFIQRKLGDVLVTFENEAELIAKEFGRGDFEVVYPSLTLLVEPPVAVVDKVVDRKGSRAVAQGYLDFLWTPAGQTIAAQNYLRPRNAEVLKKYAAQFPAIASFTIDEGFGGWQQAQKTHFDDGGIYDRVITAAGK